MQYFISKEESVLKIMLNLDFVLKNYREPNYNAKTSEDHQFIYYIIY